MEKRYRTELKYYCSHQTRVMLQELLRHALHPDPHSGPDEPYTVHSLYFDDVMNSCASDNEAGSNSRAKYRIRCYGNQLEALHLERKEKLNGRTRKMSCPLNRETYALLVSGRGAELYMPDSDILVRRLAAEVMNHGFSPKLVLTYERTAYVEPSVNVRVTFDSNIMAADACYGFPAGSKTALFPLIPQRGCILEVKFDDILPGWLAGLFPYERLQQVTFSKYYMGRKKLEEVYR